MTMDNPLYLGVDLGGTNIQAGVLRPDGEMLVHDRTKTRVDQGEEAVLDRIDQLIRAVLDKGGINRDQVAAMGIGAPGTVDPGRGRVLQAVNLGWENLPLAEEMVRRTGLTVVVDNDVNAGTWGEHQRGAGRGLSDWVGLFVGTGIGGGLVVGGQLYRGHHHTAGEIGHTVLDADAPLGRRTLENLASRTSIADQLARLIRASHRSVLEDRVTGKRNRIRSKAIARAVAAEDPLAMEVVGRAARYVGIAIANTVTLLGLEGAVVGGGLTDALDAWWIERIRASFAGHVFPPAMQTCTIVAGGLGDQAGMVGAGLLARDRVCEQNG